jgi:mitogen-activated protein kinase organizer 1
MIDHFVRTLDGHSGAINAVRLTNDGTYCMTASDDRTLKLWNPHKTDISKSSLKEEALCVQTYTGSHGYPVLDVAISQDKSKFASAGEDRTCFLWDVASNRVLRRIQAHSQRINAVAFNRYDTVLFTASYDGSVRCWDLRAAGKDPIQCLGDFKDSVTSIARTDFAIIAASVDGYVRTYDLRQGLLQSDYLQDPITAVAVSADQRSYLSTLLGGKLRLIDIEGGKLIKEYSGHIHQSYKQESAFEHGDQHIVTASEDGSLCHYHLLSGQVAGITKNTHFKPISSLACHPSMNMIVTASYDGLAKVWIRGEERRACA